MILRDRACQLQKKRNPCSVMLLNGLVRKRVKVFVHQKRDDDTSQYLLLFQVVLEANEKRGSLLLDCTGATQVLTTHESNEVMMADEQPILASAAP